ncbi:hypothetical protein [Suttonella ornithocola]|uniref:Uncharacterized protein n=1 Tax=Suttonella ornithocola TaxID=279832 RepID=A0A380MV42_9GAMM|nr:hypothetical protein [Suttonella ornithocola]SUO96449.1 Uncharacterised protein [Suttonella ornithocola]
MQSLLNVLPKAKLWALILAIINGISLLFTLIGFFGTSSGSEKFGNFFSLIFQILLLVFLVLYQNACAKAITSKDEEDLEAACLYQKRYLMVQGISFGLLLAVFALVLIIGLFSAIF